MKSGCPRVNYMPWLNVRPRRHRPRLCGSGPKSDFALSGPSPRRQRVFHSWPGVPTVAHAASLYTHVQSVYTTLTNTIHEHTKLEDLTYLETASVRRASATSSLSRVFSPCIACSSSAHDVNCLPARH